MPPVYSGYKQFVGYAKESTPGTAAAMTTTLPVTKAEFQDKPHFLDDKSWNGSMSLMYGRQQGVVPTDVSFAGNVYPDTIVALLTNVLGDRVSAAAPAATTLSAATTVGATTITTGASVAAGNLVTIDSGAFAEVVQVTAVSGSTLTVFPALDYPHASGAAVTPLNRHAVSLLNSGQGQPVTHTLYHYMGPGQNGARVYPGTCLSQLDFKFNAASNLFDYDVKGQSWPSAPSPSALVAAPSGVASMPSWQAVVGVGGTAAASPNATIMDGAVNIKRKLDPDYTLQGSQAPYSITRGELDVSGKLTVLAVDDSAYQAMRNNTQPQLQVVIATGSGWVQMDMGQAAYKTAKPVTNKSAVEYDVEFDAIITAANAGASGGRSPISVTVGNSVAAALY